MQDLFRLFWTGILALVVAYRVEYADGRERDAEERPGRQRYLFYFPNWVLPIYFGILLPVALLGGAERLEKRVLSMSFGVFLHIGLYFLLLSLLIPLLRRRFSARVCATLWLLPNYLYWAYSSALMPRVPRWAIYVPGEVLKVLVLVWLAGFLAVLGWKTAGHFAFRSRIMDEAWEENDPEILKLWDRELERAGYKPRKYKLLRSSAVRTPLTIGFLQVTIRVVLPERAYTPEELRLIFRHELVHIGREDAGTKFFLVFCTAMCWFNPLMWWAMGRSADDLELSCDETVLLDAEDKTRRQYADLLLRTAGDERGFTTCLSASAKALRYRLRHVMKPKKRIVGGLVAGAVLMVLFLSCGYVTLAFDRLSGAECIFGGGELAQYEVIGDVSWKGPGGRYVCRVVDTAELNEYLAGLTIYEITDQYDFSDTERYIDLDYQGPDGETCLSLTDHVLGIRRPGDRSWQRYFIQEDIDWDYLESLLGLK